MARLDLFSHRECILLTSKYHVGLHEEGKHLPQDIWKFRFEESCEVPTAGWFQPASEVGSTKVNQIAKLFSLSHVQYKQAGLNEWA